MESSFIFEDSVQQYLKEDYLHFYWKSKKLSSEKLLSSEGEQIQILDFGQHNMGDGPDFLNCRVKIDDVIWIGNIEIHINSEDWFLHNHQNDENFHNVILHVVYNHNSNKSFSFPTLELKNQIAPNSILKMIDFFKHQNIIFCGEKISQIDSFKMNMFKESLIIERLENKTKTLSVILKNEYNDWTSLIYHSFFIAFGMKHNEVGMKDLYSSIPKKVLNEIMINKNSFQCEALLLGQAGFLSKLDFLDSVPSYFLNLKKEYHYLMVKYQLKAVSINWRHKAIRPQNSPTLRIVQLANLLSSGNLSFDVLEEMLLNDNAFDYTQNKIWNNYYNLSKKAKTFNAFISDDFKNHLKINVVLPLVFLKQQFFHQSFDESLLSVLDGIKSEKNAVIKMFTQLGLKSKTAFDSQALLHLKKHYCNQKKCLSCRVGVNLLT